MKKAIILLLTGLSMFIFYACLGCCFSCGAQFPPKMLEQYFHCFEEGNSWVYTNQDNSKTDSLYLKHIDENIPIDGDCYSSYYRGSKIFPSCLSSDTIFCDYYTYTFRFKSQNWIYDFQCHKPTYTLYMQITSDKNKKKEIYMMDKSLVLPDGQTYSDVINCNDRFWIAPNMGIVQFRSYDGEDMFYLRNYYKK